MIRRTVRRSFHGIYWIPPKKRPEGPCILVPNHHGWHDGYVMYHLVCALNLQSVLWMEEFDAFPLFAKVGGLPFPPGDAPHRAATIRKTLRLLGKGRSLVLFGEGRLHSPPTVLPFGRSLDFLTDRMPDVPVVPVAIQYEMSIHQRPECYVMLGDRMEPGMNLGERTRLCIKHLLDELTAKVRLDREGFEPLAKGTPDVNERWDMRNIRRAR